MIGAHPTSARILLADDHDILRRGLLALIRERTGWQVVAEARDGREAVQKAKDLKPDVAVIDISMPSLNGLDATKQILKASPGTKVLILTVHDSEQLIKNVITTGARGYLLKSDAGRAFVQAIEALLAGRTFFTAKVAQIMLEGSARKTQAPTEHSTLTDREREIVQLIAEGKSTKEVASLLCISAKTAETHRNNILRKLNCHSVSEIVRYAVRNHLLEP